MRPLLRSWRVFRSSDASRNFSRDMAVNGSGGAVGSTSWRGVPRFYQRVGAQEVEGGWQVVIDGRPLKSNAASAMLLPSQGLALAIAGEFASQGAMIVPATTLLYNLASTAVDTYVGEDTRGAEDYEAYLRATRLSTLDLLAERAEAAGGGVTSMSAQDMMDAAKAMEGGSTPSHAGLESGRAGSGAMSSGAGTGTSRLRDVMLDSLETDSVCYRVDWNSGDPGEKLLRKRQEKHYNPLQAWYTSSYGVGVGTAVGFSELVHPEGAYLAAECEVDDASPWVKAVLSQVVGATKSSITTLAFVHGHVDSEGAFEASRLEEEWQIRQHGEVEDGHDTLRSYLRVQLASAAAFLTLLPPATLLPALPTSTSVKLGKGETLEARVEGERRAREARVLARRDREAELVAKKRWAMKEVLLREKKGGKVGGEVVDVSKVGKGIQ